MTETSEINVSTYIKPNDDFSSGLQCNVLAAMGLDLHPAKMWGNRVTLYVELWIFHFLPSCKRWKINHLMSTKMLGICNTVFTEKE